MSREPSAATAIANSLLRVFTPIPYRLPGPVTVHVTHQYAHVVALLAFVIPALAHLHRLRRHVHAAVPVVLAIPVLAHLHHRLLLNALSRVLLAATGSKTLLPLAVLVIPRRYRLHFARPKEAKLFDQANCKCALTACSCTDPNKVPPQGATQPNCPPCVCKPPFPAVGDPCPADLNNKVVDTVNQNTCTHTCKSKTCNPALPAVGGPCPADPTNKVVDAVDQSNCTHTCKPTCQAPKKIIGGVCKCDDCPNSTDTQDPNTCACTSPPPKCSNPLVPNTCAVGTPGRYYQNPGLPGQVHHQWDCTSGGIPLTCHKTTGCNKQCSYPKELNSNTCQCVCRQSAIDMCNGLGRTIDNNCQCNQPACSPPQGGCPSTRPDWDQGSCSCQCNISANDCPDPCQDPNTSSCSCECQTGCQDGMSSCFHSP